MPEHAYRPYILPVENRDDWAKKASFDELAEAVRWAKEAMKAATEELNMFTHEMDQRDL